MDTPGETSLGEIRLPLEIQGVRATVKVSALFDTGARNNYIRRRLDSGQDVDSIGFSTFRGKKTSWLADGSPFYGDEVEFPGIRLLRRHVTQTPFIVVGALKVEAILGALTMQHLDLVLNPRTHAAWPRDKPLASSKQ